MPEVRNSRLQEFIQRPRRAVWTLALPMMGGMLFHVLFIIVDTAFVGHLGPEALAALTFVGPLFFLGLALAGGLATGITAVIAQAIGRNDHRGADRTASNALSLALLLGCVLLVVGVLLGYRMLSLLGTAGDTTLHAKQYFQLLCLGMPLFFVSAALRAVLNGEGDARTPMIVMGASTLLNIGLDPLFIFALDMGIRGAALATLVSQLLAFSIFAWVVLIRRRGFVRVRRGLLWQPYPTLIWRVLAIGLPAAAAQLVMSLGMMLGNRLLAHFGQVAVAGFGAASRVDMIVALPVMGLAGASVAIIGMFAGAGRTDLLRSTALYTYRWALSFALVLGLGAWAGADLVMQVFTGDAEAIAIGRLYLGYMVFAYPLMAVGITSGRILQGLGQGLPALLITTVRVLVVGIPLAYALVYLAHAPIDAVWISMILGGVCSVALSVYWVRRTLWSDDPMARAGASAA